MPDSDKAARLEALRKALRNEAISAPAILAILAPLRRHSLESDRELDMLLLKELHRVRRICQQLHAVVAEQQEVLAKLTAPPLHAAVFLEQAESGQPDLAKVVYDGRESVVRLGQDVTPEELEHGDEVYLNSTRNLVVAKASTGLAQPGETATVSRQLPDGRVVIRDRDAELVLGVAGRLADRLRAGDTVVWKRTSMMVAEKLPRAGADGFTLEEVADTPRQRMGGLDALRDQTIDRFVMAVAEPELANDYAVGRTNRRLLLAGPPGCGKTLMARVIASEIRGATGRRCRISIVAGSELYRPYVGETEANIARLLDVPTDFDGISVVFLDEIDAIGRVRGAGGNVHGDRFLATLLGILEGFQARSEVVVIAATNRLDVLDPALVERFAWVGHVVRPSRSAAREIFNVHLAEDLPYRPNGADRASTREAMIEAALARLYDENTGNEVCRLTFRDGTTRPVFAKQLMSGRLIEQISVAARESGFQRHARGGEPGICMEDLQSATSDAIERLATTLSRHNVRSYLSELPADMDVLSIEPVRRKVRRERYVYLGDES